MSDKQKQDYIYQEYIKNNRSFQNIAKDAGSYPNKIRRDAIKYNIPIRSKSEAQKNAIKTGIHSHPTKGKKRSDETKNKIGKSVMENWKNIDEDVLLQRKLKAKQNWEKLTEDEKAVILGKANAAVRESSKTGSKLEKFLLESLIKMGYRVDFHKEQLLANTKLQIDLFLPNINLAIEVDGPSHFAPVWGDQALNKNKKYDDKKTGLIIGKGLFLIRIKQTKDFSKARSYVIFQKLKSLIKDIENQSISQGKVLTIGDE
jgi:very-short-patch-repair endonuclease